MCAWGSEMLLINFTSTGRPSGFVVNPLLQTALSCQHILWLPANRLKSVTETVKHFRAHSETLCFGKKQINLDRKFNSNQKHLQKFILLIIFIESFQNMNIY